jgi:hypothetical protein
MVTEFHRKANRYGSTFTAVSDHGGSEGAGYPYASVGYERPKEEAATTTVLNPPGGAAAWMDHGPISREGFRQREMFMSTPGEVTSAFAHPSMKHTMGGLLGMAVDEHRRMTGSSTAVPGHDASLSPDSSRLVQRVRSTGVDVPVNPKNPGAEDNNTLNKNRDNLRMRPHELPGPDTRVSPDLFRQGAQTTRSLLRGPGAGGPSPQPHLGGEQLKMFMSPREISSQYGLGDMIDREDSTPSALLARKYRESAGPLRSSIVSKGIETPIDISMTDADDQPNPVVADGHHRLAVGLRHDPDRLAPVRHGETFWDL